MRRLVDLCRPYDRPRIMLHALGRVGIETVRGVTARLSVVVASTMLLAACDSMLRPRFGQVEQATEALHGGGERYRDHRRCSQSATSVQTLIDCMDAAHWHFVSQGPEYPERDCWESRERGELERLPPHCFVRAPEHP